MKFGIAFFPTEYAISITELAVQAEGRGFESLWVAEHSHIPTSRATPYPAGGELRSDLGRSLPLRHRRRLEPGGDGRPRHAVRDPLEAPPRAGRGHAEAVDRGRGRVPGGPGVRQPVLGLAQAAAEAVPAGHPGRPRRAHAPARGPVRGRVDAEPRELSGADRG